MKLTTLIPFILLFFLAGCNTQEENTRNEKKPLFRKVEAAVSGVHFSNKLNGEKLAYIEQFPYAYNGGGTAIGDLDNDGLQDIVFSGNEMGIILYKNKGNLQFEDITESAKISYLGGWYNGISLVDINADGFLDIYSCRGGWYDSDPKRNNLLYLNNGDGTFTESAAKFGIADIGFSTQASFFDFDNDNDLDMYLVNRPGEFLLPIEEFLKRQKNPNFRTKDKLFRNDEGNFTEVSEEMGITNNFGYGLGVVTSDVNKDGFIDIYVSNDYDEHDYLYINKGGKRFEQSIEKAVKHIPLYSMGVDIMDINNDGLEDILTLDMAPKNHKQAKISMPSMNVALFDTLLNKGFYYQYMHNMMQLNQGDTKFSDVAQLAGLDKTDWSWSALLSDFDNDGLKDVFITNGFKRNYLDQDLGGRVNKFFYANMPKYAGPRELLADKEQEIIDLYQPLKERNYLFRNQGDLTFSDVSENWGFNETSFSNGASVGDLDNDGDLDIVVNNLDDKAFIFENTASETTSHLRIRFTGPINNPLGLGTKVELTINDSVQYQELKMVRGYLSSQEPFLHFGIGKSTEIDTIKVTWLDGKVQKLINIKANQTLVLAYAEGQTMVKEAKSATLFEKIGNIKGLDFVHKENVFDDYKSQVLLPHKYSQFGPGIAVADVNDDGLDDVYFCGASGQAGSLALQQNNGTFKRVSGPWQKNSVCEELSAEFFDANSDGKLDLYIVSGGNEFLEGDDKSKDHLYLNNGQSKFSESSESLPDNAFSGSQVRPFDYDQDGDLDLFVGGRLQPQNYPFPASSHLYRNDNGMFTDVTETVAPELIDLGLVTDGVWLDIDSDGDSDLVVVGEWMPITIFENEGNKFSKVASSENGLSDSSGWWYSIDAADFDNDGDIDLVAGNLGTNYKYRASVTEPFEVFAADFDQSGKNDIILSFNENGVNYPLRGKECSSQQLPHLRQKFQTYESFSEASVEDMVGKSSLDNALHLKAKTFATTLFVNNGAGSFITKPLASEAQLSSVNDFLIDDFNNDGHLDIILAGNLYTSEIETSRNDASFGLFLSGDGKGNFEVNQPHESGLYLSGDIKSLALIKSKGKRYILAGTNDDEVGIVKLN